MPSKALKAAGVLYRIKATADATTALDIAEITDIGDPPGKSRESLDVSNHKSPNLMNEFIAGFGGVGEVKFTINWVPGDEESDKLFDNVDSGVIEYHEFVFPNGIVFAFNGFVMDLTPATPLKGVLQMTVTVQVTGDSDMGTDAIADTVGGA